MNKSEKNVKVIIGATLSLLVVNKIFNYRKYSKFTNYITDIEKIEHKYKFKNKEDYYLYLLDIQSNAYKISDKADICRIKAIKPLKVLGMKYSAIIFLLSNSVFKESVKHLKTTKEVEILTNKVDKIRKFDYLIYLLGIKKLDFSAISTSGKLRTDVIHKREYITLK